jgi:hypothetical protein
VIDVYVRVTGYGPKNIPLVAIEKEKFGLMDIFQADILASD